MILPENALIDITSVEYMGAYRLHLFFSDGKDRLIDFEPFFRRSLNPLIRKYLDLNRFQIFTVQYGDLFWDDYDLCFPIADLYEGGL